MTHTPPTRIWLNGDLVPVDQARIEPGDRGLLLADGLFETVLVQEGHPVRLAAHSERLVQGAEIMRIPLPLASTAQAFTQMLVEAVHETLKANALDGTPRASVRITLTRGSSGRGLALPQTPAPTLMISATPVPPAPMSASLIVSTVKKLATSPASALKTLNYTDHVMARMEADAAGASDALMQSATGGIACATIGNVFVVSGTTIMTPADDGAIRAGITRNEVLTLAKERELTVLEADISLEMLASASEVFLTNSLWGICPVHELDGRLLQTLPDGITKKLAQALEAAWASDPS